MLRDVKARGCSSQPPEEPSRPSKAAISAYHAARAPLRHSAPMARHGPIPGEDQRNGSTPGYHGLTRMTGAILTVGSFARVQLQVETVCDVGASRVRDSGCRSLGN